MTKIQREKFWLIYGANGQMGQTVIREALSRGYRPVLGGRSAQKISELCSRLELSARVWGFGGKPDLLLRGVGLLINCAGPFRETALPLSTLCRLSGVHYLDLSQELLSIETVALNRDAWIAAKASAVPGICPESLMGEALIKKLTEELTEKAASASLTMRQSTGPVSRALAASFLESVTSGCLLRRAGKLEQAPPFQELTEQKSKQATFSAVPFSGAELFSVWHASGIPDITAWRSCTPQELHGLRFLQRIRPLSRIPGFRNWLAKSLWRILKDGPTEEDERTLWLASLEDQKGGKHQISFSSGSGPRMTAVAVVDIAEELSGGGTEAGVKTPGDFLSPEKILNLARS